MRPPEQPEAFVHVIVPFYNAGRSIVRCLDSIRQQNSKVNVLVVDDASGDESGGIAERLCARYGYRYHRNVFNMKCPFNLAWAIEASGARPWDVIFLLDGDDYLPNREVFARVTQLFEVPEVWLTYGQYMSDPPDYGCAPATPPPHEAIITRTLRFAAQQVQFFNHPLVFRKFLWDAIPDQELHNDAGEWFTSSYDRTIMIPMLEMATGVDGLKNWLFLNEILYVYNSDNPTSEIFTPEIGNRNDEVDQIYNRPPLEPLTLTSRQIRNWFGRNYMGAL